MQILSIANTRCNFNLILWFMSELMMGLRYKDLKYSLFIFNKLHKNTSWVFLLSGSTRQGSLLVFLFGKCSLRFQGLPTNYSKLWWPYMLPHVERFFLIYKKDLYTLNTQYEILGIEEPTSLDRQIKELLVTAKPLFF